MPMLLPLLSILFFFSGACALVYQVMWLRLLALVFGVTVYAASTVLASFMGGLAIGSYASGRFAGRLRSPLRVFGFVEIGVGVSALATPLVLEAVKNVWIILQPSLPSSLLFLTIGRFLGAVAVLIVPTTLMGATLPIVMRSALVTDTAIGSRIGLLYAINTAGAIVGALTAGFYFVPELGVSRSFQIAALTNTVIGLIAIAASYVLVQPSSSRAGSTSVLQPPSSRAKIARSYHKLQTAEDGGRRHLGGRRQRRGRRCSLPRSGEPCSGRSSCPASCRSRWRSSGFASS